MSCVSLSVSWRGLFGIEMVWAIEGWCTLGKKLHHWITEEKHISQTTNLFPLSASYQLMKDMSTEQATVNNTALINSFEIVFSEMIDHWYQTTNSTTVKKIKKWLFPFSEQVKPTFTQNRKKKKHTEYRALKVLLPYLFTNISIQIGTFHHGLLCPIRHQLSLAMSQ